MNLIVNIRAETLLAMLSGAADKLAANLRRTVERLSIEIQTAIKRKLSGPVLHNVTGTLRRSINRLITQDSRGIVATEGTNVRYAAIHEYGFDGPVNVSAHPRMSALGSDHNVRAHVRHLHMPARSYLRSTLTEFEPRIRTELKQAALASLR